MKPSTMGITAIMGITAPVAALSFVVKSDEMFPAAELVVGLEEAMFEAEDTNVVEGNGSVVIVRKRLMAPLTACVESKWSAVVVDNVVDVTLATCTRAVAISTG